MPSTHVYQTIKSTLEANWTNTTIRMWEELFEPGKVGQSPSSPTADLEPWLELMFIPGTEETKSIGSPGNNFYEEQISFQLTVFVPVGELLDDRTLPWLDELGVLFRNKEFNGVQCDNVIPSFNASGFPDQGNWMATAIIVQCRYRYFS